MASGRASVLAKLARVWLADPKGSALLFSWAATFGCVTLRAVLLKRSMKRLQAAAPKPEPAQLAAAKPARPPPLRALLKQAIPGWKSTPAAWGCLLSVGIGLRLIVNTKLSSEIGVLGSLLAQRRWDALFKRQLGYALLAVPAAVLNALQKYAAANLALSMRMNLMHSLHDGFRGATSLPLVYREVAPAAAASKSEQDSAVQMATADIATFCTEAVSLFEGLFKPSVEVVILSSTLGRMMGGRQLAQCYAYFVFAGCWARFVGPSFATMSADVQLAEGTLAAGHARLHEYAEEVTLLAGQGAEARQLDLALERLRASAARLSLGKFGSEALDGYALRYMGILSAFTAMLPAVYHGTSARAADDPTEYFLTCLHMLVNVGMACKDLVLSFKALTAARGVAARVDQLRAALEAAAAPVAPPPPLPPPASSEAAAEAAPVVLELSDVAVAAPDGTPLVSGLSLRLLRGQRLLLTGPNGSGKTSLLRVLAGVWPPAAGTIAAMPARRDVAFLPQRSYAPPNASLREMLLYPRAEPSDGDGDEAPLLAAMRWAGLSHLAPDAAALRAPGGCAGLSGGEQQRLTAARLRLHKPALAVLDEASAALEPSFEAKLFAWCASSGITLLTISHNAELRAHHTLELALDGGSGGGASATLCALPGGDLAADDEGNSNSSGEVVPVP